MGEMPGISEAQLENIISELLKTGVAGQLSGGGYVLLWDLTELTLAKLHKLLPWPLPNGDQVKNLSPAFADIFSKADHALDEVLSVNLSELMGKNE